MRIRIFCILSSVSLFCTLLLTSCVSTKSDFVYNRFGGGKVISANIKPILKKDYKDRVFYFFLEKNISSNTVWLNVRWRNSDTNIHQNIQSCALKFLIDRKEILTPKLVSKELKIASYNVEKGFIEHQLQFSFSFDQLMKIINVSDVEVEFICNDIYKASINQIENRKVLLDFLKEVRKE